METSTQKQAINLVIDCYRIPLMIERDQEPIYRRAAVMLNETYAKYVKLFPRKAPQELWVYVALEVAVNLQSDTREKDLRPVMDKVRELSAELARVLENENG